MSISISQNYTAIAARLTASFLARGGTAPYVYSVLPGGAGGVINSSTGVYTAPSSASSSPKEAYDTIRVTDGVAATTTARILVGTPLMLFCDIIQKEMNLTADRIWLWDQKIFQPTDYNLYIAVSVPMCKPFGNSSEIVDGVENQFVNIAATVDIDIISRGPEARDRKEEVILALNSLYAEQQQEACSFFIGRISNNFINLSNVDASAIPYRYKISCTMQYCVSKNKAIPYFDTFTIPPVIYTDNP